MGRAGQKPLHRMSEVNKSAERILAEILKAKMGGEHPTRIQKLQQALDKENGR
tara:strand:- start:620 stop:778 length:159 start_codon:yes stop_codon:yes gene_type:complete